MITCAIVDDEPLAVSLLQSYVQRTPVLQLAGTYHNAIEAMAGLQREPVDLLFLDIQMPEWNGLDFARVIDTSRTCIIFTTAFSQYAPDGYKVNAVDYLLKPIAYTDFASAVARAQKHLAEHARPVDGDALSCSPQTQPDIDSIFVKSDYKQLRIRFSDILYIEGLKDYVKSTSCSSRALCSASSACVVWRRNSPRTSSAACTAPSSSTWSALRW